MQEIKVKKTFTVPGKKYDVKTEKLVGGQKKLDKDKDGDIDKLKLAMLRKAKKEEVEFKRYHETKQGSLKEINLKNVGEKQVVEEGIMMYQMRKSLDVKVTVKEKTLKMLTMMLKKNYFKLQKVILKMLTLTK